MRQMIVIAMCLFAGSASANDGLLIVAPEALASELDEFVAFKQERLETELVTLESVLATSEGVDDPEKVKRFLYGRWRSGSLGYVLLVGDADVMPVRYMVLDRNTEPAFNYAFYPSDLYYGDVAKADGSFESWNAQAEGFHGGYFGEVRGEHFKDDPINYDQIDYRPELGVGRWPVSTPESVALVASKTIRYERGVEAVRAKTERAPAPTGEAESARMWPGRAGLVMVRGWVDARPRFENVRRQLAARFEVERRYYDGEAFEAGEPSAAEIVELLNQGVGLLLHAGHGSDDSWHDCLGTEDLGEIRNADRLAIVMSAGCSTARFATLPPYEPYEDIGGERHTGSDHGELFDAPPPPPAVYARGPFNRTGLGERLVAKRETGAVAYIGCNTGSQPCGLTLLDGFAEAAATLEKPRLGDCWKHAVSQYWEREKLATLEPTDSWYPASIFFQGMKFMVFGDPTAPVGY